MEGLRLTGMIERRNRQLLLVLLCVSSLLGLPLKCNSKEIGMAVELMDHAACAYVARNKGWFAEAGLTLSAYESYVTGMALAAALARGDIQVAYLCLVPAINVYANAKVPLKIIAGTHKYGYGLVVDSERIKAIKDLQKPGIRIGSVREGGAVDVFLHRVIHEYALDKGLLLNRVQRMNPPKQVLAIKMGKLDAAFLPEQWATMVEDFGFTMLVTAKDVWPGMQGSVLVVKDELMSDEPRVVRSLVRVTQKATDWVNEHPNGAATIMSRCLSITGNNILPLRAGEVASKLELTPHVLLRSMARLEYTTSIDPGIVQETIDYAHLLGYIKRAFRAEEILDLRFLR